MSVCRRGRGTAKQRQIETVERFERIGWMEKEVEVKIVERQRGDSHHAITLGKDKKGSRVGGQGQNT